jgi:hypothetical protein
MPATREIVAADR